MADLEKNILVVIPVNEDHKKFLEEKAASGDKNCCIRYVNGEKVTSDEPGLYIEGSHGIRTENLSLCRKAEKNGYGQFMCFENMTFAPIDLDAVDISVMEPSDVRMLNAYHKEVREKLSPYMTEEENEWLKEATRPIGEDYTWRI